MKKNAVVFIIVAIIIIGAAGWYFFNKEKENPQIESGSPTLLAQATYGCNEDKTIEASFYEDEQAQQIPEPGQPPIPAGSVTLVLSDGRNYDLPQTISAYGSRYANSDESFVFWSKGQGALVLENNEEKSYQGCVVTAKDPGGLPNVYHDGGTGFSIRYPANYSVDSSYKYQALGPGEDISGVKFTIPNEMTMGTNLSRDTAVSVETIPETQNCNAGLFLAENIEVEEIEKDGQVYSFASFGDTAAGNVYVEYVWAIPDTNPCGAVRYLFHYGVIENYPEGTVSEFNHAALMNEFDKIRQTLVVL